MVWTSLHSALKHDQKKFFVVLELMLAAFLIVFSTVRIASLQLSALGARSRALRARDPVYGLALRRGIFAYRKFG